MFFWSPWKMPDPNEPDEKIWLLILLKICGSSSYVHPSIEISNLSIKVRWREKISSKFTPWSVRFEGHKRHCCAIVTKGRYWFWAETSLRSSWLSLAMGEFVDEDNGVRSREDWMYLKVPQVRPLMYLNCICIVFVFEGLSSLSSFMLLILQ